MHLASDSYRRRLAEDGRAHSVTVSPDQLSTTPHFSYSPYCTYTHTFTHTHSPTHTQTHSHTHTHSHTFTHDDLQPVSRILSFYIT